MKDQKVTHKKRRYDTEFKKEALRLSDSSGKKDSEIEQDLGLYPNAIGRWRKALETDPVDAFPASNPNQPLENKKPEDRSNHEVCRFCQPRSDTHLRGAR